MAIDKLIFWQDEIYMLVFGLIQLKWLLWWRIVKLKQLYYVSKLNKIITLTVDI